MIEQSAALQPQESRPRTMAEAILAPPKVDKKGNDTHGKFKVEKMIGSGAYEITPATDPNEIHDFDEAHKIKIIKKNPESQKSEEKSIPLSDFFLENPASLLQMAFEGKFITQHDLDLEVPVMSMDESGKKVFEFDTKTGKPVVSRPLSFIKIDGDHLVLPKNLTPRQVQDVLLLVFQKTVNTDDFVERKQSRALNKLLLEEITLDYTSKLKDAGKVTQESSNPNSLFTEEPVLQALNIACRKAVEARLKDEAYRKTKISLRKGETAEDNLLSRLSIAAGLKDETKKHSAKKEISEMMHVRSSKEGGKQSELEYSASIDLFVAQAFDILIPADVRLQLKKDQIEADATLDHVSRGDKIEKIQREKQVWRMAILKYFQVERNFPGKLKIPTIAQESADTNIFSPDEVNRIDDYRKVISSQIDALDAVGGFNKLDLSSANLIKTKQLLEKLVPRNKGEQVKIHSKRINDALVELFGKCTDLAADPKRKPDEAKKLIEKSGLLKGLKDEERELAFRILTEAFGTQMNLEIRLTQSTKEKIGAQVRPTDIKLGTNLNEGMKGMDFLYRRGKEEQINEKDRYKLLSEKGKANFEIKTDKHKKEHIVALGGEFSDEEYRKAEAAMSQTPVAKKETVKPAPIPSSELTSAKQKEKDERSVELAKLLSIPNVNNYKEFQRGIEDRFGIVVPDEVGDGTPIEYEIPTLELTDADGLESLSHLAELFPDNKIRIVSLGLTVEEGKKIESVIKGMEIATLVLSGSEVGDNISQITFEDSTVSVVEVTQGKFVITTAKEPDLIRMNNGNGKEKIIDLVLTSERSLNNSLDTPAHGGTIFAIDSSGSVIVDLHRSATDKAIIYSDLEAGDTWSNAEKIEGENVLVLENGIYKLKQIPEAAKPSIPAEPPVAAEPAATPLGEFKPLSEAEFALLKPDEKLEYHQAELKNVKMSAKDRLRLVGEIVSEAEDNGVKVDNLRNMLTSISGLRRASLATSPVLAELVEAVQKLRIPEATPAPEVPPEKIEVPAEAVVSAPKAEADSVVQEPFDPEERVRTKLAEALKRLVRGSETPASEDLGEKENVDEYFGQITPPEEVGEQEDGEVDIESFLRRPPRPTPTQVPSDTPSPTAATPGAVPSDAPATRVAEPAAEAAVPETATAAMTPLPATPEPDVQPSTGAKLIQWLKDHAPGKRSKPPPDERPRSVRLRAKRSDKDRKSRPIGDEIVILNKAAPVVPPQEEAPAPAELEVVRLNNSREKVVELPEAVMRKLKEKGQGDLKLVIAQGDLLAQDVDAITNAALDGCAVGDAKTTEGFVGNKIIHAVGPDWEDYANKDQARDLLASTIKAILREARTNGFKSIAIPAISTGIFHFPVDQASKIIRDTIYEDLIKNGQGPLKEVRLVLFESHKFNQFDQDFSQVVPEPFSAPAELPTSEPVRKLKIRIRPPDGDDEAPTSGPAGGGKSMV